jgi:hypothetical protein
MSRPYRINESPPTGPQLDSDHSFIGGLPKLPVTEPIPTCTLCGSDQTFFFQVAFPDDHEWGGLSLAVFACISCADEESLIPEMLPGPLCGVDIPKGFLTSYQRNFRFLVFSTDATLRRGHVEKVRFKTLVLEPSDDPTVDGHKIGGAPNWALEDEAPGTYASRTPMVFLLQLQQGYEFETVEGAPRQMELDLDGKPKPAARAHYHLFLGNALYLFGTGDLHEPLVYAVTQVD